MPQPGDWGAAGVDVDRPSAARIYDYALGGAHNFAVDRAVGAQLFGILPETPLVARSNRAFLQRVVRFCGRHGITQFLDLGSGIPTVGNVHEIAHQRDPASRVVYVDNEPVAVATTRRMLDGVPTVAMVQADLRDVDAVLTAPQTQCLINFAEPLALLMVAALHYVSADDDLAGILSRYKAVLAPGSFLAVSHTTWDPRPEVEATLQKIFNKTTNPVTHRSRAQVAAMFDGLELIEPGVVWTPQWRPEDDTDPLSRTPERSVTFAGVGRVSG